MAEAARPRDMTEDARVALLPAMPCQSKSTACIAAAAAAAVVVVVVVVVATTEH